MASVGMDAHAAPKLAAGVSSFLESEKRAGRAFVFLSSKEAIVMVQSFELK